MPNRAARPCATPGCPELVNKGNRCATHAVQRTQATDERRGSAAGRGYGRQWRGLRLMYLRANPLCVACAAQSVVTQATEVDHIQRRADGGADEWSNFQSLCKSCHSRKTATEGKGGSKSLGG